jgi:hypothetical protein
MAPGVNELKLFSSSLTLETNKLECLFMTSQKAWSNILDKSKSFYKAKTL